MINNENSLKSSFLYKINDFTQENSSSDLYSYLNEIYTISSHKSLQNIQSKFAEMKEIWNRINKSVTCEPRDFQTVYSEDKENIIDQLLYSTKRAVLYFSLGRLWKLLIIIRIATY